MPSKRVALALTVLFAAALGLSACSETVSLEPADDANNYGCAEVSVRLPADIDGLAQRATDAQATSAWGKPASVILRCGLEPVYASTLTCVTAGNVDWLVDDSQAPTYRFITFARKPATEVIVDSKHASGVTTLEAIAPAVQRIKATRQCLGK